MESKCIKKSTMQQLKALVEYMEENPEFARGSIVFGSSKLSVEGQWAELTKKLNALGPPVRTIVEWKKSWSDLKSRTKKKIAENKKSLSETGGGLYGVNVLSELEQVIDRTLFLSKAAAPAGNVFGFSSKPQRDSPCDIEKCFIALSDTPPRSSKSVAVITPTRQQEDLKVVQQSSQQNVKKVFQQKEKRELETSDGDLPGCSSAKKKKSIADEQIGLIRRQLRVGENSAALAKEQIDSTKALVDAAKALVESTKRIADAAEIQAESARKSAEIQTKILSTLQVLTEYFENKK